MTYRRREHQRTGRLLNVERFSIPSSFIELSSSRDIFYAATTPFAADGDGVATTFSRYALSGAGTDATEERMVTKRFSHGFQGLMAYTYGKVLDWNGGDSDFVSLVQNDNNARADHGTAASALLAFVPAPGVPAGSYGRDANLVLWTDMATVGRVLPEHWGTVI